jgi:ATP-dependent DNA helicase RecG
MYHPPLGDNARQRLAVLRDSNDGFLIAQKDLELRGPGEVLGTRQTGEMQFRVADLVRDRELIEVVRQTADPFLRGHPQRVDALVRRWIGDRVRFADA